MNITNKSNTSTSPMANLLAKHKNIFVSLTKGQIIKGKITKLTNNEILLDINAKTEAVVLEKERKLARAMNSLFKVGETVDAQVLNPESENGNPVVSLRRFLDEKVWEILFDLKKKQEKINIFVVSQTKGGFLIETEHGVSGFLPHSHILLKQNSQELIGKNIVVSIAELNKETRKLIVSQKPIMGQEDFAQIIKKLSSGTIVDAIVSHVSTFGIFVSIPVKGEKEDTFLDGFVHISEVSWEKVNDLYSLFKVGDAIKAVVMSVDNGTKRIELSIKKLTLDPFSENSKQFTIDKKVNGKIEKIIENGIVIDLDVEGVEGFIRKEKLPPTVSYTVGQKLDLTVTDVDSKKHRIYLAPILLDKPLMYR